MLRQMPDATLRIGELARRTGVSTDLLRAWERRYALLEPTRTAGDYRLYSAADEARIRSMQAHLTRGLSAAEAARLARDATALAAPNGAPADLAGVLWSALDSFDDAGAQAAFDRLVAAFSIEAVATIAILPYLQTLGDRWSDGDASIAQEHFASGLLRARLLGLARGWDRGAGPRALLACPPGEHHDLGLIILGLALRDRGWRVTFLGPNTPIETLGAAADQLAPDVVVLSALAREPLVAASAAIARMATSRAVLLAGPGADAELAEHAGARLLTGGPIEAADKVAA
jgi:DNA-binding transcriptional MerR regulator/methylmalonyl-CoA mutase cobalamin-binding subunit